MIATDIEATNEASQMPDADGDKETSDRLRDEALKRLLKTPPKKHKDEPKKDRRSESERR